MTTPEPMSDTPRSSPRLWWQRVTTAVLVVYWLMLFTGTHAPIDPQLDVPGGDKTLHFAGYGGLAFLLGALLVLRRDDAATETRRFPFVGAMILLAAYGAFDELTQLLVGRHSDILDWLADIGGIIIGLATAVVASRLLAIWRSLLRESGRRRHNQETCDPARKG